MIDEAYFLRIEVDDGTFKYIAHSDNIVDDEPSFKSLMNVKDAKTKRTKLLKVGTVSNGFVYENEKEWKIKSIEICKATIDFGENV